MPSDAPRRSKPLRLPVAARVGVSAANAFAAGATVTAAMLLAWRPSAEDFQHLDFALGRWARGDERGIFLYTARAEARRLASEMP